MRSSTNQLQREYWMPLFIVGFVFIGHFTSLGPYTYTISTGPTCLVCPFFYLSISLNDKKQISFPISWFSSLLPWLLVTPVSPRPPLLSQRLIEVFCQQSQLSSYEKFCYQLLRQFIHASDGACVLLLGESLSARGCCRCWK